MFNKFQVPSSTGEFFFPDFFSTQHQQDLLLPGRDFTPYFVGVCCWRTLGQKWGKIRLPPPPPPKTNMEPEKWLVSNRNLRNSRASFSGSMLVFRGCRALRILFIYYLLLQGQHLRWPLCRGADSWLYDAIRLRWYQSFKGAFLLV